MKIIHTCSKFTLSVFYSLLLFLVFVMSVIYIFDCKNDIYAFNEEQRCCFLEEIGFGDNIKLISAKTVKIPFNFDDFFLNYNKVQNEAGFDLSTFHGKETNLYEYSYNDFFIHLLTYNGKIVGGDICNDEKGLILPLNKESVYGII